MKQPQIIQKFILGTLFFLAFVSKLTEDSLATNLAISLTPSLLEVSIKPGRTITQSFVFQNSSNEPQTFVARIIPLLPGDGDGSPTLKPNLTPEWLQFFSLSNSNIKLNSPFTLSPNQSQQLVLTISIPNRITSQDIYAALLVSSVVKNNTNQNSTLGAAIGSNIIMTISSQENPPSLVKITQFDLSPGSYLFKYADYIIADSLTPIVFEAKAKNLGKYYTKTNGVLKIDTTNQNIYTQSLVPKNILSSSERVLEGTPSSQLRFTPKPQNFGIFIASLDIRNENASSHAEINLVILPIKLTISLIISIVILTFIIKFTKKNQNER